METTLARAPEQPSQGGTEVERMVEEKDSCVAHLQLLEERQHEELASDAARLANGLRVNRAASQHLREQVSDRLKNIHDHISAGVQQERQERRERHRAETQLEHLADESIAEVRGHLAEDNQLREEAERYTHQVRDEICHLYSDMEQARQYRIEAGQRLADGVKLKLGEIRDAVAAEQRIRLESQNTLLQLFGQMGKRMDQEIESARKERHLSTDRVIALMEAVLPKMDEARKRASAVCHEKLHEHSEAREMANTANENLRKRRSEVTLKRGSVSYRGSIAAI